MRNFSVYIAVLGFTMLLSAGLPAEIVRNPDANTLWAESFATPDDAKTWMRSGDRNRDLHRLSPMPKLSGRHIRSPHTSPVNPQAFPD